ncbi:MAG: hypothetical protein V3T05_09325 [Myxococcota bacterium]
MRLAATALLLGVGLGFGGCSSDVCGGNEPTDQQNAPWVDNFWVLDLQIPGDPWTVLFGIDFTDPNGDLGVGAAEFFLNAGTNPAVQPLVDAFRQSGVSPDETRGSVWMALRFSDTMDDGTEVSLGLQLVDGDDNRSNCYSLDLRFDVTPLASAAGVPSMRIAANSPAHRCGERS